MRKLSNKPLVLLVWPNFADNKGSHCHSTEGDEILSRALDKAGLKRSLFDIRHTELVPKILERGKKPTRAMLSEHSPSLHIRIEKLDPSVVLAVGAVSFEALTGMKRIMEWVGRELQTERGLYTEKQWTVIPTLHPDHVAMVPLRGRELHTSLTCAVKFIEGQTRIATDVPLRRKKTRYVHYGHDQWKEARERLNSLEGLVAFDYETSCLEPSKEVNPYVVVCGFCVEPGKAFTIELGRDRETENYKTVKEWLLDPTKRRMAFNGKFEIKWSRAYFRVHPKVEDDPMLKHVLLEEESSHKLEILALNMTTMGEYDREVKVLKNQGVPHHKMPMHKIAYYCAGDCDATVRVNSVLDRELLKDPDSEKIADLYRNESIPTMHVLSSIEGDGICVDRMALKRETKKVKDRYLELIDKLHSMRPIRKTIKHLGLGPNEMFNVASSEQVVTLLYQVLDCPVIDLTKTGAASAGDDALARHKDRHACVPMVRELRGLHAEIRDLKEIRKHLRVDGFINTNLLQEVAVSGRLSSRDPNLQNMGVKSVAKKVIVSRFVEDGVRGEIQCYDYKQQEVIVMASLSGEKVLLDAFTSGLDVHTSTAATVFGIPYEEVDPDTQRYPAKRITFGVVFGIGPKKLANEINWEIRKTEKLLETYFKKHPSLKVWIEVSKARSRASKRSITEFGRVRRLPNIVHPDDRVRWAAERAAVNHRVQGTAANVTMRAVMMAAALLKLRKLRSKLILTVHDSLVFDVHPHERQAVKDVAREAMIEAPTRNYSWLRIPFQVELKSGPNYLDLGMDSL